MYQIPLWLNVRDWHNTDMAVPLCDVRFGG
jgi:hypothetical protein